MVGFVVGLELLISSKVGRDPDSGQWYCLDCDYVASTKQRIEFHIEAKHVQSPGHTCEFCQRVLPTKNALNLHRSRKHKPVYTEFQ